MAGENAEVRIIADLQRYVDEVKKLGPITDQEAIKAAFALESRVTKASEKAAKAAETAAKQAAEASTRAARKTGAAFDDVGETAEKGFAKLGKAAALTGDAFGGLAGPIGDVGDAFGMMDPRVAAVVVTVGALIGTFSALVSTSLDVIRNADDYGAALGENEDAIYSAKGALEDLDYTFKEQKATIAGVLAPAVEFLANAYIGLSDKAAETYTKIEEGPSIEDMKGWALTAGKVLGAVYGGSASVMFQQSLASDFLDTVNEAAENGQQIARDNREEMQASEQSMRDFQRAFEEFERQQEAADRAAQERREKAAAAAKKAKEQEAKDFQDFINGIGADAARALEAMEAEQKRIDDEAFAKFVQDFDKRQAYLNKVAPELQDLAAELYDLPDIEFRISSKFDTDLANMQLQEAIDLEEKRLAEIARLQDEAAHEAYVRDQEQRKAYEKSQVDGVASISSYIGQTLDTISGMFDENTKEGRKAIRELAVAQKAAAIFDVAIKGVQAVMAALTVPPPAGTALAVVAGAAAVASAAAVAAQPLPSFHTGRFAGAIQPVQPDEGPALLRRGEVVVPATTVAANGGVDQVRRRLGESGDGGGRVNVFLDLSDRTVRVPLARDIARSMNRTAYLGWAT